jgi:hypothetical protein
VTIDAPLPARVDAYLRSVLFQRAHPLLLSFDAGWRLRDAQGDASFYGIDIANTARGVRDIEDLFIGLDVDKQRAVVEQLLDAVVAAPAQAKGARWTKDRLSYIWKQA